MECPCGNDLFGIAIGSVALCNYVGIKWQNNSILGCAQYLMPLYSFVGVIWALSWFAFLPMSISIRNL